VADLLRISVRVPIERADEARAELLDFAAQGFEERDLPGAVELIVYGDATVEEELRSAFGEVGSEAVEPGWEDRWRAFHRPVEIGRLWVGPPWEEPSAGLVPVVIDPGRAFGTGAHATTRLCLELLQELTPASLVDIGCGSGVLAIAAAKIGFEPVFAVDDDPEAIEATLENAEANSVSIEVRLADALVEPLPATRIAICNISLPVLEKLLPRLECETLVASGFLVTDELDLAGYRLLTRREQAEWAVVTARRQS
jgi:ribosomal protein L11 methyltransferase